VKIALYIEDGLEQLVLTPESEHERNLLGLLNSSERVMEIYKGTFYGCRGGWMRWAQSNQWNAEDASTMIVLRKEKP